MNVRGLLQMRLFRIGTVWTEPLTSEILVG
jgi:hypothetical protein